MMRVQIGGCHLELVQGDLTQQDVDAIVNAANSDLEDGSGVNGAIQAAAGPGLLEETARRYPQGCTPGSAVISGAGNILVKFIIHAVGPTWKGGQQGEEELLKSAYRSSLELAIAHRCQSIAFPAISTGVYGYPLDLAARHSLQAVIEFLRDRQAPPLVRFVLWGSGAYSAHVQILEAILPQHSH